jgi:uncharacterized protein (TIGR01244 family)
MTASPLSGIRNVRVLDEHLATSGQPSEAQLAAIAAAGYEVLINLALHDDPRYSLADEAGAVAALGMRYLHIPVVFSEPHAEDLQAFLAAMDTHAGRRVWVHCAVNYRVGAFVGLWRVLRQGWSIDQAFAPLHELWAPDATWRRFIDEQIACACPAQATPDSMAAYYARRAREYDQVYAKPERQADIRRLEALLPPLFTGRRVLELACGTGWWTPHAAARAIHWLATDLNPETLALAQTRAMPPSVEFRRVDAYTLQGLQPGERFDAAFAGFWWSHVPHSHLPGWLATLYTRLQPGARLVLCDNREVPGSTTPISRRDAEGNTYQQRRLADGSTHEVLKNFPTRDDVAALLGPRVKALRWTELEYYWLLDCDLA